MGSCGSAMLSSVSVSKAPIMRFALICKKSGRGKEEMYVKETYAIRCGKRKKNALKKGARSAATKGLKRILRRAVVRTESLKWQNCIQMQENMQILKYFINLIEAPLREKVTLFKKAKPPARVRGFCRAPTNHAASEPPPPLLPLAFTDRQSRPSWRTATPNGGRTSGSRRACG